MQCDLTARGIKALGELAHVRKAGELAQETKLTWSEMKICCESTATLRANCMAHAKKKVGALAQDQVDMAQNKGRKTARTASRDDGAAASCKRFACP